LAKADGNELITLQSAKDNSNDMQMFSSLPSALADG